MKKLQYKEIDTENGIVKLTMVDHLDGKVVIETSSKDMVTKLQSGYGSLCTENPDVTMDDLSISMDHVDNWIIIEPSIGEVTVDNDADMIATIHQILESGMNQIVSKLVSELTDLERMDEGTIANLVIEEVDSKWKLSNLAKEQMFGRVIG